MKYRECPKCGAHLDAGEVCDCQKKEEDAPDAAGTPSNDDVNVCGFILSDSTCVVNRCLNLRSIMAQTGAMGKDAALIVRDKFPKFNRQLLTQCKEWSEYGVIIHPDALKTICEAYGVQAEPKSPMPDKPSVHPPDGDYAPSTGMTQCDRILRHFRDYGSITSLEAMKEYGIMRLASRISDLRRLGYDIAVTTERGKNRYGEKTSYARYSLREVSDGTTA